jgi:hypothetical protein
MECFLKIQTGTRDKAGTDSGLTMIFHGPQGRTGANWLSGKYENGNFDTPQFNSTFLSPVSNIEICHDGRGDLSEWDLEWLEVNIPDTSKNIAQSFIIAQ